MSASFSKFLSKYTTHISQRKEKESKVADIQPTKPPPSSTSRPQSVSQQLPDDVRNTDSREAGSGESPSISRGDRDAQRNAGITPPKSDQLSSITMFQEASNFQINNANLTAIGGNATIIQFGKEQFTEVQRILIGDYIATLTALPGITDNLKKHILIQTIINLPRAEAVFNDYQTTKKSGPCFEGTRVALLREIASWATGQDESRIYILSGLAGIGKSTVAYTIASRAADLNLLGASFFFSRDDADRNNAKRFFTTIAYQLCVYDEHFSKAIGDALQTERGSSAVTKGLHEQLRVLILDPLRSILQSRTRPILVVVDALDECDEGDVRAVIQGLSQLVKDLPSFKVVLTTRPQPLFDHLLSNQGGRKLFCLQDIEDKIVEGDIRLYLKYHLSLENVKIYFPKRQWHASDEQIDLLVRAAGRLFIVAATSVRYILDQSASNPAAQIQELIRAGTQDRIHFKDLDDFYTIILRNAVPANCDNYNTICRYQSVVGAIVLVQRPLPISALAPLIDMDVEEIHAVLDNLKSVILCSDDGVPRVYHKSFSDYLMDKARCKDSNLQIDPKIGNTRIATCCFKIADKYLKYNILGLGTPARIMDNERSHKEDGITDSQLLEKIPHQLRYACIYWVAHLELANVESDNIMNELDKFVNRHTLHWFEVLSIIEKLDTAHRSIRGVLKLLKSPSSNSYRLLSDALRFISKFYEIINKSALHLYYSALPFSPTDSHLYYQYIKEAKHGIYDVESGPKKWDAIVADLSYGNWIDPNFVKFSLNSAMLVTYSNQYGTRQGQLKIWDAFTGTPISSIPGDRFAICSDFSMIASSKNNVVTYYNPDGSATGTMVTTPSKKENLVESNWDNDERGIHVPLTIENLALSSESNRLAAALVDGTVCLWENGTGKLIDSLHGYRNVEYNPLLQFSPSGTRIVYSSGDGIVKLRDGIIGRFVADLQCGLRNRLVFSADSSRVAALSLDHGLALWNSESGELIGVVMDGSLDNAHLPFGISANGSLLAAGDRKKVMLWSEDCNQLIKIKVIEYEIPLLVTFSLDNKLATSHLSGIEIYNIETHTISTQLPRLSSGPIAFSPDGTRLVCGTCLCDVQLSDASGSPSKAPFVTAIALSRDSSRLSCGRNNATVELWETSPTLRRIASKQSYCTDIGFGPDDRLFASWSSDASGNGDTKVWNSGDGSLVGTLNMPSRTVALSNNRLVAGNGTKVTLWDLETLSLIHTFETFDKKAYRASISDQGDLAVISFEDNKDLDIFDLENRTCIATFHTFKPGGSIAQLTFLPDKSHLVVQYWNDKFLSLNLVDKHTMNEALLGHIIQLPNIHLWQGMPLSLHYYHNRYRVRVPIFEDEISAPVLWIPTEIIVKEWTQGSSMIALGCKDGQIILLRLRTNHGD